MTTTAASLPAPVARLVAAVNSYNTPAFLDQFTPDGWVDDNGRRFTGHDQIRRWSDQEFIGAGGQMHVTATRPTAAGADVDVTFTSTGFNGYSLFSFQIAADGDHLAAMSITA